MLECSHCEEEFEELEDWGKSQLCGQCAKYYKSTIPKKPKSKQSKLVIAEPKSESAASYNIMSGATKLRIGCYEDDMVCESINHEFFHFLLHRIIGIRCCYQFDNVDDVVDPYHGLS